MKGKKFTGIMPALVTPYLEDNQSVDHVAAERVIDFLLRQGANGFYVLGGTGEGLVVDMDERANMCDVAIQRVNKKVPVIVHVSSMNLNETVAFAKYAEKAGADAIAAVPPFYFFYDENDIYEYYKKVAAAVQIPVIIYYYPGAQANMSPELIARIFEIDNVTGVKWSSNNYYGMLRLKDLTQGDMNIINGPDETLCCGLMCGADAGIGSTYNVMLPQFLKIFDLVKSGKAEDARNLQIDINRTIHVMIQNEVIPAVKCALDFIGYPVGTARFPMRQFTQIQKDEYQKALQKAGFFDLER